MKLSSIQILDIILSVKATNIKMFIPKRLRIIFITMASNISWVFKQY